MLYDALVWMMPLPVAAVVAFSGLCVVLAYRWRSS